MSHYSSIQFKGQKIAEALRIAEHDGRMQSLPAILLKRLVLLFSLVLLASPGSVVYGQQTVSWRTEAANGNWENGDCSSIGTANSQWWYAGFTPNNSRNRPDCNDGSTTRHNVEIANDHQTTMSLNTAFWGLRSLTLTNAATSNRTFNGSPDDATRGISLTNGLYNNSNSGVTHNFNVRIGIDATSVTLRTLTSGATTNFAREIFGNANTVVFDGSGATNVTSFISGAGATVSKQGTGTLTLSGANTYTGNTSIVAGILRLGAANVISNSSNMVLAGGTFSTGAAAGFAETLGTLTVSANSTLAFGTGGHTINFANSNATTWGGFLFVTGWTGSFNGTAGTAGRFFAGNSTTGLTAEQLQRVLFLNGSNYHTATILASGEVVPSASVAMFWNGGGVASWTASNAWSQNPAGPYNQTWTSGRTAYFNLANNTITGATTNAAGIVALGNVTLSNSGTLGFGASGGAIAPIYVASGATFTSTQDFSTAAGTGLIKNGPGVFSSSNSNNTGLPAGITLNNGALVWGGVSGFGSGTLTINGGVLSNNNATAKSPNITSIVANADFAFGSTALVPTGTGNLTFAAAVNLGSSTTRTITLAQPATYAINGIISGSGSNLVLNASAAGTLSLGGANTYGGNTTINGGTLLLTTGNNRLPVTTNLTLANTAGATFNLGNQAQTIASLSGGGASGGNILTGGSSGDLTVDQTTSTTYAGVMSGTGDLIKTGNGVLTLSGANTYSGVTTLSAGTLLVNGSTASTSAVTVAAGATLGGSGTTAGTVALNGTVAPGSAATTVGTLNTGAFTFNPASSYRFDISNVSGTAGTNWDLLASSGQIGINSSSASPATIFLTGNPAGFNSCTSYTWRIAQGSSISSFDATKFTINTASFIPAFVGTFSIQQSGNALNLVYSGASLTLTSAAGTNAQLSCINTAITNITYATTGATGATVTGLPASVTSNWASNVLTISGTPTAYGLYTYTVTLTGTCSSVSTTGTINVNGVDWSNLQFPASTIICQGSNTTVYGRVFELGITEAAGSNAAIEAQIGSNSSNTNPSGWAAGNWANATFNVQAGNNDEYQATFGSTLTAGTYYYTFRFRINGCAWQYGGYNSGGGGFWDGTTNISGVLTVNPPTPAQPATITGTATQCPALTSQTYSITAVTNATSYNWTVPAGWTITANTGTSITVTTGTSGQNGNISVTAQNSCGTSSAQTLAVTVSPATPAQPAAITGAAVKCPGLTGQTYSIGAVTNATSYNWTVPTGWTITAGSGTNGITVTTGSAGQNGNISVTAQNSCGTSSAQTLAVTVSPATPAAPAAAAGSNAACTSISANWAASANATAYFLDVSTVNTFASFVGAYNNLNVGNVTTYSVTGLTANTTYYYRVRANNSCGSSGYSTPITYATLPVPAQPSTITGTLNPEIGLTQAYSVTNVAGVTYTWSFSGPNGWSVASGQGSNAIVANVGTANTTITVVPSNTCGNGTSRTIATTIPQYRARFISANYGASPWCQGESRSISVVVKNTGVASWTNASPDVNIGAKWNTNGGNWGDYNYRLDAGNLAPGTTQTYTFAAMQASNATGFTAYNTPPTYVSFLAAGNNNITFDIVKEVDCWFGGNGGSCGPGNAVFSTPAITISPAAPAQPGVISGTAVQCPSLTGQTYSIAGVANASSYNWSVPAGWSITANTGTSITVTTGSAGQNGNISVTAQNSCGTSIARTLAVTVSPATPAVPTAAAGTNAACTTISANWAASTNATAYFLDVSTSNTFASFVGAYNNFNVGNVTTYSVTGLTAGVTYYYRVRANNSCGTSASSSAISYATLPATPAQPGTITGTTNVCAAVTGQIYSISAVANATTYNWTVPTGWTITAGAGTTSITVTAGAGGQNGNISVTAQNSCGTSSSRTLGVTVTANPTVNVGAGLAAICAGGNSAALGGSVTAPATGGTWTSSAGGTFNPNATTLNATWTAPAAFSGTAALTLTSSGGFCGTATGTKSITVNPLPSNAGAISGSAVVCRGQSGVAFSVPSIANATTYTWSYTGTGFTPSGSTASITGSFSASATSGNLTVRGVNSCGNGVVSAVFPITVDAVPAAAGAITGSSAVCQGQNNVAFSVPAISGATSYQWSYSGTGFTPSGNTASITANFSASATSGVLTVHGVNSCGNGVVSANYSISLAQLPATPGTVLGPNTVCKGQAGFSFLVPAIANASSYEWQYTGTGVTFSGNTNLVTISISNTATPGNIRVRGVSGCLNGPWSAPIAISIIDPPTVSITSNYCGNPGFVILTASSGFSNYLWSTGANTPFINADIAGQYTVTVANSFGCMATASVGVATELVTNGNFNAGNTGFTTNYTYVADIAGQTEMYPEGTYAVVPNANTVHNMFWGTGHTPSGGNYMVVNGSPALGQNIWSQNNIAVQPNTTYYFSAWGLSVVNGNNAVLRFSINGNQVGTIASLPNGYTSTAGPFNWVRFYGSWNSGFATTANLSIVNLNTILGGNDFGLDDISFGTLSPVPLAVAPSTILGTTVCQGNELVLNANAVGGASPFTYQWTGPNGFTSTLMNPTVTASAAAANAGTYTLTVTDGFGCTATSNVVVTISALPTDKTPLASIANLCVNDSSSIEIPFSQNGVSYQLRNNADDSPVGDPVAGTGATIIFPVDNLLATTTYNVLATGALTQCSVEMANTVTITVAPTPVLTITNQAVCSGTVDLTNAAVTAGSTGSGTLSYWTNATATTALASPASVSTSGVYYIQSAVGACVDIEPVSVSISTTPLTGFSYPTTPYCSSELDPAAGLNANAVAGVFTSLTAGLVFSNTATGTIDLSASTPGTYTVRNTVSPAGGCSSVNSTSTVVITQAPLTDFTYDAGSDFCQVYSAVNPAPVFAPGAAAGTFASTFGLNFVSTSTGVVNIATSTPGNYAIWNTRPAIGGCAAESDTVFVDINPYVFAGTVSSSVSDDIICLGETVDLFSQTTAYNSVLLRERFNGTINNWVRSTSGSVGGTAANAAWALRPTNYVDPNNSITHRSNDNTQFYMTNSQAQAGTSTLTTLRSPVMNTVGYTNLNLDFFHYFNTTGSGDTARVQVSLNGTTWTSVATYTTALGSPTGFANPVINLNAYIGQPIFYVRFQYKVTNDRLWAIDNVSLTGNCNKYTYNWVSAPAGFTSTLADPVNVAPPQNSFYVVNATNTFGCSNPASPVPVTVNDLPILTSNLTPPAVCGNELFTYAPTATPSNVTIDWTRPAATGISNAAITTPQLVNPSETLVNTTNTDKNVVYNIRLNNNGCEQVVPVTVAIKPVPVVDIGTDQNVCNGSPAQLNTTITNGLTVNSYAWLPSTGLSNDTISSPTATVPTASQSYTLTVEASNGCSNTSAAVTISNIGFGGIAGLWLGTQNSLWDNCRNWADGKVPTALTNVVIDPNATNDILITGIQECNSLSFISSNNVTRSITVQSGASFSVLGNVALNKDSGTGSIRLSVKNNATVTCNNLSIKGTAAGAANAIVQKDEVNSVIMLNGDLSIEPGGIFDMSDGNNATPDGVLNIKGDFVNTANAADFIIGNASVIFNGSALQTITSPANQDFGKFILDNSSVAGVKLNNNIDVSREMQFVNGVLDLNQNVLTLGSNTANAVISGSGNNSYILAWDGADNGSVVHRVNSTGSAYLFPIGDTIEYTPFVVNLTSATLSSATLTAKLYGNAHPLIDATSNIYLGRYWSIEPTGITNPLYNVSYTYGASDIFGDESFLFPAKFNTGGWQSCLESMSNAMIGNGSVDASTNTLSWTGITTFSEFTGVGNGNPLPIELLNFTAEPVENEVKLAWTTASETNNSFFTVERSTDGVHFEEVVKQDGAGNSNGIRNYDAVDANPYLGVSYYRLKQTDFNGDFTYSDMVPLNFLGENRIALNSIFADRANGTLNIRCSNPASAEIKLEIFDANGRLVIRSIEGKADKNWNGTIGLSQLSGGSYIARVSIAGKLVHGKFIY